MDDTLEVRKNPELAAGSEFKKAIVNVHKNASDLYKQGRQIFKDQKIKANNTEEIKDVTRQMKELEINDELAPGYGTDTKEYKAMQKQLHALENETFDATDLFDMQRTLEKASKDATKMRFSTGISDQARTRYKEIAERYSKNAEVIQKALESVGGQEVQAIFKEANKGWKTYHDAKKNSVGRAVMLRGKGQIPSDTLVKLANEETGNAFFNALLDNDPKLRKNVLAAYVGKKNPDKLILTDDTTKEYLKKLPEVDSKLNDYKIALRKVAEGKISGKEEIKAHDALSKAIEKTAQEQKVRADAIKKSDILKKEIQFHKDAIPELEKRRLDLEGKKQQLENVKGQNAEKVKALKKQHEKEIQDIDHEILMHKLGMEDKNHRLKKIANAILKMPGVSLVARKIGL
jgi:hypothetical protein